MEKLPLARNVQEFHEVEEVGAMSAERAAMAAERKEIQSVAGTEH